MDIKRVLLVAPLLWFGACSDSGQSGSKRASNTLEVGTCAPACLRPCDTDSECDSSTGDVCCDFGTDGRACVAAAKCPKLCKSDTECRTEAGEACFRATPGSPTKVCMPAQNALKFCKADGDCGSGGEECCGIYREPICVPRGYCPKTCSDSSGCDSTVGETCCTTMPFVDPALDLVGLCLSPYGTQCPKACVDSSDCSLQTGGTTCCHGVCKVACDDECSSSSDCNGQVCCKTRAAQSPLLRSTPRPFGYPGSTGSTTFAPGCTTSPQCGSCQTCYEQCYCALQSAATCISACGGPAPTP